MIHHVTITDSGEVILYERGSYLELKWYTTEGDMKYSTPPPADCTHNQFSHSILYLQISKEEHIAFSCPHCSAIWLWKPGAKKWTFAWQATHEPTLGNSAPTQLDIFGHFYIINLPSTIYQ